MKSSRILWLAAGVLAAAPTAGPPKLRLGDSVRPVRYSAELTVIPGQDTFSGSVDIELAIREATSLIWVNATELKIKKASVHVSGRTVAAKVVDGGKDFTGFALDRPLSGSATLHVEYVGQVSKNSSAGLFQMRDGAEWYLYSQFEPTDARRAFPCFDEPAYKTPWQLTLHVKKEHMAVSNTPAISERDEASGMKTVKFAVTKPLPSYLVALAAGRFEAVDAGTAGRKRTPVRVIVTHGRAAEAQYAVKTIPPLLELLEKYFSTPYPYEKLDSISMPISDFAMENAGLITYGQSSMLSPAASDTINRQRGFAQVAAHEMAHQWFGNLTTTAWWDDIWLNEAFASWMEGKILSEWKPEWQTAVSDMQTRLGAMKQDSLVSARRIRQPIESDSDIANAFDGITYNKGEAVIQMFESWIGAETFRKGIKIYLDSHSYGNATSKDFIAGIGAAARRDVGPAFFSFLNQPGVPVVSAGLKCDSNGATLKLDQKRSLPIGSPGSVPQTWQIPVCVRYEAGGSEHRECAVLTQSSMEMKLEAAHSCPAWVLANDGENGYYRVRYQDDLLARLLADGGRRLTLPERAGVLGDVLALVETGDLPPETALSLVPAFGNDPNRQIVASALGIAALTRGNLVPDELLPNAARFIGKTFGERAHALGWLARPGENDDTRLLRQNLTGFVAMEGEDKALLDEARKLAPRWLADRTAVDPDMAAPVLTAAVQHGDRALFDSIHGALASSTDRRERETMIAALGSFRDPRIAKTALGLLLTDELDAREAFFAILFGPLAYRETRTLPFRFVQENLDKLLARLPREVGGDYAAALSASGNGFCDAQSRAEVEAFFKPRVAQYVGGPRNLAQTLESIDLCIAQRQALGAGVAAFLKQY